VGLSFTGPTCWGFITIFRKVKSSTAFSFLRTNRFSIQFTCLDIVVKQFPQINTVTPRLTKIIRSGITFVSRNTHTDGKHKLLEWPDRSCLLLYGSAHPLKHPLAESIFVSRVRKTAKKIFVSRKIR